MSTKTVTHDFSDDIQVAGGRLHITCDYKTDITPEERRRLTEVIFKSFQENAANFKSRNDDRAITHALHHSFVEPNGSLVRQIYVRFVSDDLRAKAGRLNATP